MGVVLFAESANLYTQSLVNGLTAGSLIALIALGYTMVYGIVELINFAHGDVFMLGTFFAFTVLAVLGLTGSDTAAAGGGQILLALFLMLLLTPVFCAALNWGIDRVVYKPLRRAPKLAPLVSAIGVSFCLMNLGMFWNGVMPEKSVKADGEVRYDKVPSASGRNFPALLATPAAVGHLEAWGVSDARGNVLDGSIARSVFGDSGGLRFTVNDLLIVLVTIPLMIGLTLFVKYSSLGKAMRATAQNPTAAQLMGINVDRVIGLTFIIGGVLAGFGSVVAALTLYNTIDYQLGYQQGLYAFTAAVLGGIGNIPGAVLGALVIGLVQSFGSVLIGEKWTSAMVFVILIVMLVFRPTGLLGSRTREKV